MMKHLPGIWIAICLLASSPVAIAMPTPQQRAAQALSQLLKLPVAAQDIEIRQAANLSSLNALPSPLRRIAGTEKRYLIVRLKAAEFRRPVVQATFEPPPNWPEALADVGAVAVAAANSSSAQSCWIDTCEGGSCQTLRVWVDDDISCPPAESGAGTGTTLSCTLQMCRDGLGCETMPVAPLPNGNCPTTDMCTSDDDCLPPMRDCPANECFCAGPGDCRCMEESIEVPLNEACPTPECKNDSDCTGGGGSPLLDDILETTTPLG